MEERLNRINDELCRINKCTIDVISMFVYSLICYMNDRLGFVLILLHDQVNISHRL